MLTSLGYIRIWIGDFVVGGEPMALLAQSVTAQTSDTKKAVALLRTLASEIKDCPEALDKETRRGKRVDRLYFSAPHNVTWDIKESRTPVRSPFEGFIEFSVSYFSRTPDGSPESFATCAFICGNWRFRYEFDVGSEQFTSARVFYMHSDEQRWLDAEPRNTCWDAKLRRFH